MIVPLYAQIEKIMFFLRKMDRNAGKLNRGCVFGVSGFDCELLESFDSLKIVLRKSFVQGTKLLFLSL